jgi:hypothetical protein
MCRLEISVDGGNPNPGVHDASYFMLHVAMTLSIADPLLKNAKHCQDDNQALSENRKIYLMLPTMLKIALWKSRKDSP